MSSATRGEVSKPESPNVDMSTTLSTIVSSETPELSMSTVQVSNFTSTTSPMYSFNSTARTKKPCRKVVRTTTTVNPCVDETTTPKSTVTTVKTTIRPTPTTTKRIRWVVASSRLETTTTPIPYFRRNYYHNTEFPWDARYLHGFDREWQSRFETSTPTPVTRSSETATSPTSTGPAIFLEQKPEVATFQDESRNPSDSSKGNCSSTETAAIFGFGIITG